jgi:hypothetical protein
MAATPCFTDHQLLLVWSMVFCVVYATVAGSRVLRSGASALLPQQFLAML